MRDRQPAFAPASQIAQVRIGDSTNGPQLVYSANLHTEITRITVANTTSTTASFRLFHDDDGTVYSTTSALFYNKQVAPADSLEIAAPNIGSGYSVSRGGTIGAQVSATAALTITLYGITEAR